MSDMIWLAASVCVGVIYFDQLSAIGWFLGAKAGTFLVRIFFNQEV